MRAEGRGGQRQAAGRFNEAEARAPRMSRRVTRASTRPICFNEAEAIAPPMRHVLPSPQETPTPRFTKAQARAPRMLPLLPSPKKTPTPRFNEAEARAPRMPRQSWCWDTAGAPASMRPRRARLGCHHPTSHWTPTQSRCVFDRWRSGTSKACWIPRAIILTMSNSPPFQQSSKIRAGVELLAAHRHSKAPGSSGTPTVKPAPPFRNRERFYQIPLNDSSPAFHFRECLADALDSQLDFIRWPDINQEHVVLAVLYQLAQPRLELGAAPPREPALDNGKLQPLAIAVHGLEHAPPALRVGNVVGDDKQAFVRHRACSARQKMRVAGQLAQQEA